MLMMLVLISCTAKTSEVAALEGIRPLVNEHSEALLIDGGPKSLLTGARLIKVLDDLS